MESNLSLALGAVLILTVTVALIRHRHRQNLLEVDKTNLLFGVISVILGLAYFIEPDNDFNSKIIVATITFIVASIVILLDRIAGRNVTKKIGKPYLIEHKMQYYDSRKHLPLHQLLNNAKKKLIFVSVTNEHISADTDFIRSAIVNHKLQLTVRTLHPKSSRTFELQKVFGDVIIVEKAQESLDKLVAQRDGLPQAYRHQLIIETFDTDIWHSLILADPEEPKTWIQVENYPIRSKPLSRPSLLVFKKDNEYYYTDCVKELNEISQNLKPYP